MRKVAIKTKTQALSYIEEVDECLIFPYKEVPDLFSNTTGRTIEERREKIWRWCDELQLEKKIFSSLAVNGRGTITSWDYFKKTFPLRSQEHLSKNEKNLITIISKSGPIATPDLLRFSKYDRKTFNKAIKGLRRKMRVAVVNIKHKSKTKHIHVYDLTERWVPKKYLPNSHGK